MRNTRTGTSHRSGVREIGSREYAQLRRERIDRCRDYRDRYLVSRASGAIAGQASGRAVFMVPRWVTGTLASAFVALVAVNALVDLSSLAAGSGEASLAQGTTAWLVLALGVVSVLASGAHIAASAPGSSQRRAAVLLAAGNGIVLALLAGATSLRDADLIAPGAASLVVAIMAGGVALVCGGVAGDLLGSSPSSAAAPAVSDRRRREQFDPAQPVPERVAIRA